MSKQAPHIFIPENLFGIIGYPLGHSLSPLLHNRGFQKLELPSVYYRWPLLPAMLPEFITAVRTLPISGVSVTIPHKRTILPHLDGYSQDAMQIGAVNTLYWKNGKLWGDNTDVQGFLKPLEKHLSVVNQALILGVGGAARAVLGGLKRSGILGVVVTGRNNEAAKQLAEEFAIDWLPWEDRGKWQGDLLVNATPLGMKGSLIGENPWPVQVDGIQIVYDLVYNPGKTVLLENAFAAGASVIEGVDMFVAQAIEQFSLWTGHRLDPGELRCIIKSALL